MRIKLTEQQFRRIMGEQTRQDTPMGWAQASGDPDKYYKAASKNKKITHLTFMQPSVEGIGGKIQQGVAWFDKNVKGTLDVITQSFDDAKKQVNTLVDEGVLSANSLKKLTIMAHGDKGFCGEGGFTLKKLDTYAPAQDFLKFLSTFTTPNTTVMIQSCNSGDDPYFIHNIAKYLGVKEVTAPTGIMGYHTLVPLLTLSFDGYVTCPGTMTTDPEKIKRIRTMFDEDPERWYGEECKVRMIKKKGKHYGQPEMYSCPGGERGKKQRQEWWDMYWRAYKDVTGSLSTIISKSIRTAAGVGVDFSEHQHQEIWRKFISYIKVWREKQRDSFGEEMVKLLGCKTSRTNPTDIAFVPFY